MMIDRDPPNRTADSIREYPARFLSILWVISSVALAALGPFGTFERLGFLERLLNWAFAIGMSILVGLVVNRAAQMLLGPGRRRFVYDLVAVPAMTALYSPALFLHIRFYPLTTMDLPLSFIVVNVFAVCLMLIGLRELLGLYIDVHRATHAPATVAEDGAATSPAPLLERLPARMRGEVLHVCADNHYIAVRTEHGVTSILMRMSDALRELQGQPGLQVHRSHWVSDRAVRGIRREGSRLLVLLPCGTGVPVSRTQAAVVTQRWGHVQAAPAEGLSA